MDLTGGDLIVAVLVINADDDSDVVVVGDLADLPPGGVGGYFCRNEPFVRFLFHDGLEDH